MVVVLAQKLCPKLNATMYFLMHRIVSGIVPVINDLFVTDY